MEYSTNRNILTTSITRASTNDDGAAPSFNIMAVLRDGSGLRHAFVACA